MKYFRIEEFNCQHTGKNEMNPDFLEKLDHLREVCGFPFVVTSGYRDKTHPEEAKKERPGKHNQGIAVDISVRDGVSRYILVKNAIDMGFNGIGIAKTFIHIDSRAGTPVIWTY